MAPPDEDYRRRIQLIHRIQVRDPEQYLMFCCNVARLAEKDKLPDHLRRLRDNLAQCIRNSSHRPLTLDTPQWINDEWMRDFWFDVFGPEPAPGDPYPALCDAWGSTRWTPAMRALADHGRHPDCDFDDDLAIWCRTHRLDRRRLIAAHDAGVALSAEPHRAEPPGYRDRLGRYVKEGTRRAMPGEEWYGGETDVPALLDADRHDTWWTEVKRLQSIADEAATSLQIDDVDVLHFCPDDPLEHRRADWGTPSGTRAIGAPWRWWRRRKARHFQLLVGRQVATQPDSIVRGIIGHEMAHVARRQGPSRRRRKLLVVAAYVATVIVLNAIQAIFSLDAWQALPIVIPSMFALVMWHSWLKRREELACDVLAASIGMPITDEAAAWLDDNYGRRAPRRLPWLDAPFREHPSWAKRLDAIRRATSAPARPAIPDPEATEHASTSQSS